jgi:hypothetical protein
MIIDNKDKEKKVIMKMPVRIVKIIQTTYNLVKHSGNSKIDVVVRIGISYIPFFRD